MLAGMPDPLGSGQMIFEVSIKQMPDDVDDNRNALSKTLYKYLYTIKMEHTGLIDSLGRTIKCQPCLVGVKRNVDCSWKELFSVGYLTLLTLMSFT